MKYDDVETGGKRSVKSNGEIVTEIATCKDDDNSLEIDFYPFAYALHDEQLTNRCWYCLIKVDTLK